MTAGAQSRPAQARAPSLQVRVRSSRPAVRRRRGAAVSLVAVLLGTVAVAPAQSVIAAEPTESTVLMWGYNGFGQVGDDPVSHTPVEIPGMTDIVDV